MQFPIAIVLLVLKIINLIKYKDKKDTNINALSHLSSFTVTTEPYVQFTFIFEPIIWLRFYEFWRSIILFVFYRLEALLTTHLWGPM